MINKRLVFKIEIGYKSELKTPETIKLFGSKGKIVDETKKGENVPRLEVTEMVIVQWNLVEKQFQEKSEVLCTCTPNKSHAY